MKRITASLVAVAAAAVSVSLFVPSSFAAKAMNDNEMDSITAKGQSAIDVGTGDQTILDKSRYTLTVKDSAQSEITAGNVANVAGENNVASAINAGTSSGSTVDQNNRIDQNKSASYTDVTVHKASMSEAASAASLKAINASGAASDASQSASTHSFSATSGETKSYSETPVAATITISGTVAGNANSTASGNATAANTTTATGNANSTDNTTLSGTGNGVINETSSASVNNSSPDNQGTLTGNITDNGSVTGTGNANSKNTSINAAIGASIGLDLVKADGKASSKADGSINIDLPKAKTGNSTESSSMQASCSSSSSSSESSSCSFSAVCQSSSAEQSSASCESVHSTSIIADTVKIGNGDQKITDCTNYKVELKDNAQQDAVVLNMFNVAGRNNAATAWNVASDTGSLFLTGSAAGALTQKNTINQLN